MHFVAGAQIATPLGTITASIYAGWHRTMGSLYDANSKFANFDLINGVTGLDSGDVTARIAAVAMAGIGVRSRSTSDSLQLQIVRLRRK